MRLFLLLVSLAPMADSARAQQPLHLTLAEAKRLAIQNNPRFTMATLTASAAGVVMTANGASFPSRSPRSSGV